MNCRQPSGDGQAIDHSRLKAELIEAAAILHGLGLSVIPIRPGKKGQYKSPALKAWRPYQAARMPPDSLLPKIERSRDCVGIAVILGAVSGGLMVRDFDTAEGYHAWALREPHLASILPTVRTAKGFHVYARSASPIATRTFHGAGEPEPGELRGEGGYVVTAPSLHASGIRYAWAIPPGDAIPVVEPSAFIPPRTAISPPGGCSSVVHKTEREETLPTTPDTQEMSCVPPGDPGGCRGEDGPGEIDPEQADIRRSLPGRTGERNCRLFDYLRRLKARLPGLGLEELRPRIESWHRTAYPAIGTKDFAETWDDACRMWPLIKCPKGSTLREKIEAARSMPIPPGIPDALGVLLNLCGRLADADGNFFLGVSTAQDALGMGDGQSARMTAWRRRRDLIASGLVEKTSDGAYAGMKADGFRLTPKGRRILGLGTSPTVSNAEAHDPPRTGLLAPP